jgi:hypothetical protein
MEEVRSSLERVLVHADDVSCLCVASIVDINEYFAVATSAIEQLKAV